MLTAVEDSGVTCSQPRARALLISLGCTICHALGLCSLGRCCFASLGPGTRGYCSCCCVAALRHSGVTGRMLLSCACWTLRGTVGQWGLLGLVPGQCWDIWMWVSQSCKHAHVGQSVMSQIWVSHESPEVTWVSHESDITGVTRECWAYGLW